MAFTVNDLGFYFSGSQCSTLWNLSISSKLISSFLFSRIFWQLYCVYFPLFFHVFHTARYYYFSHTTRGHHFRPQMVSTKTMLLLLRYNFWFGDLKLSLLKRFPSARYTTITRKKILRIFAAQYFS